LLNKAGRVESRVEDAERIEKGHNEAGCLEWPERAMWRLRVRYAIVSDIHANMDALEAVFADAGQVDEVWCLGDIVDMGPQPNECLEILRERGAVCIFGNHEKWVSGDRPPRLRETPLEEWALWTNKRLTQDNRAFLDSLPERVTMGDFTLLHFPRPGFDPPGIDDLGCFASSYCLIGHTHLPLLCRFSSDPTDPLPVQIRRPDPGESVLLDAERAIVNVGSVGYSFVDTRLACYALIDVPGGSGAPTLTFRAVRYSVENFVAKLQACGVPSSLAALRIGVFDGSNPIRDQLRAVYGEWYPADGITGAQTIRA
jgi:predicted phosphodiesterase